MKFTKQQWQWIFYDWANSGYGILVITAVLPVYFKAVAQGGGVSAADSTAFWGYANSFGTLVVSLLAPLLGALADYPRSKRRWLNVFTWTGIILTLGLAVVSPRHWQWLLGLYILSIIGYSGGNLFYDSFLTDVADDRQMDLVSSTGYGMGYLGGRAGLYHFPWCPVNKRLWRVVVQFWGGPVQLCPRGRLVGNFCLAPSPARPAAL